jgi:hypothetical protein
MLCEDESSWWGSDEKKVEGKIADSNGLVVK